MSERNTDLEQKTREELLEKCNLLLKTLDNKKRIENLENQWFKHKLRYEIVDFFLIFNAIDVIMKSIFGIGVIGCIVCFYRYIIGLF